MKRSNWVWWVAVCGLIAGGMPVGMYPCAAAKDAQNAADELAALFGKTSSRGVAFLRKSQESDGSFSSEAGPAVTCLAVTAALKHGVAAQDPLVANGVRYVERFIRSDGGVYQADSLYRNYETCLAILCFTELDDRRLDDVVARARDYVTGIQWGESEDADRTSPAYGGAGYGSHKRPDLSNTSFLIEALRAAGVGADDEAIQRALIFVSSSQNLESQYNTLPFAAKNPDGGFYYTPAAGGASQAGFTDGGGLRSYGSMTYAGLKSMIYAGLGADDPRVLAAVSWIQRNYELGKNPGMPTAMEEAGLYYYYHTFAKALDALGERRITDEQGREHDWRAELLQELSRRQQPGGSWVNQNPRWLEGDANLVTAYALLALSYCRPENE